MWLPEKSETLVTGDFFTYVGCDALKAETDLSSGVAALMTIVAWT